MRAETSVLELISNISRHSSWGAGAWSKFLVHSQNTGAPHAEDVALIANRAGGNANLVARSLASPNIPATGGLGCDKPRWRGKGRPSGRVSPASGKQWDFDAVRGVIQISRIHPTRPRAVWDFSFMEDVSQRPDPAADDSSQSPPRYLVRCYPHRPQLYQRVLHLPPFRFSASTFTALNTQPDLEGHLACVLSGYHIVTCLIRLLDKELLVRVEGPSLLAIEKGLNVLVLRAFTRIRSSGPSFSLNR